MSGYAARIDAGLAQLGFDPEHMGATLLERLDSLIFKAVELDTWHREHCAALTDYEERPNADGQATPDSPESVPGRPFYRAEAMLASIERTATAALREVRAVVAGNATTKDTKDTKDSNGLILVSRPFLEGVLVEGLHWKALALGLRLPMAFIAARTSSEQLALSETLMALARGTVGVEVPVWIQEASMRFTRGEEWCPVCQKAWATQDGLCGECVNDEADLDCGEDPAAVYCDLCNEPCEDGFQTFDDVPGAYHFGCSPAPGFVPLRLKNTTSSPPASLQGPERAAGDA